MYKRQTAGLLLNIQDIKDREEELEAARLLAEKAELKQSFISCILSNKPAVLYSPPGRCV